MDFNNLLKQESITIKRTGAMGDVIWTTPIFKYIRDAGYAGKLIAATQYCEVFKNNPCVTDVVAVPQSAENNYVCDLDWVYESNRKKHMLAAYCEALGIDFNFIYHQPLMYPSSEDDEWAMNEICSITSTSSKCRGVVVIHAAATSPDRIWSCLRWERVVDWLVQNNYGVICVGSAKDYHVCKREYVVDLVGCTSIGQTTMLIEYCEAFIGMDSGVANIAFSTATPSLVLYGMAKPETRVPVGSMTHHGIVAYNCDCIGCLEKLPVNAPPLCHEFPKSKCLDLITVEMVLNKLQEILQ